LLSIQVRKSDRPQSLQPQQTGVLFMLTQQVQPHCIMVIMHVQQSWIILDMPASPLVQVMQTPSVVISHLHRPMVMLHDMTFMPFIIIVQVIMPPASILQRFCIMAAAVSSLAMHFIFMPPFIVSILKVQRGIIIMFIAPAWAPIIIFWFGIAAMPIMPDSIIEFFITISI
jgi:hypothetical protein